MHTMLLFACIRAIHCVLPPYNRNETMSCCLQNKNGKGGFESWQYDQARRCFRAGAVALQGVSKCSATGSCAGRHEKSFSMKPAPSYEKTKFKNYNVDRVTSRVLALCSYVLPTNCSWLLVTTVCACNCAGVFTVMCSSVLLGHHRVAALNISYEVSAILLLNQQLVHRCRPTALPTCRLALDCMHLVLHWL